MYLDTPICAVAGCDRLRQKQKRGHFSLCCAHRARKARTGSVHAHVPLRTFGHPQMTPTGYVLVMRRDHPLAWKSGHVLEHRAVLYDELGPGEHLCHWCDVQVSWEIRRGEGTLMADHLDGDKANNSKENLVVSCGPCNSRRYFAGNEEMWVA